MSDQVGIAREVELDQAGVVTGVKAESIAQGLAKLAGRPTQLTVMGQNAHLAAENRYDIRITAKKVERAYLDILEGVQSPDLFWSNGEARGKFNQSSSQCW